jgi:hypothetical protein
VDKFGSFCFRLIESRIPSGPTGVLPGSRHRPPSGNASLLLVLSANDLRSIRDAQPGIAQPPELVTQQLVGCLSGVNFAGDRLFERFVVSTRHPSTPKPRG